MRVGEITPDWCDEHLDGWEYNSHTKTGKAWCPCHDDEGSSMKGLSVSFADGIPLLKCHSVRCGATGTDVLAARNGHVEVEPTVKKTKKSGEHIEATYDYGDFQVVRYEGKDFKQRRRVGNKWVYNLSGVTTCLYRQGEVREAVARGATIYVVEGEKDVERLRGEGLVATCNPMGAGKWRDEYAEVLRDAEVLVVADRDDAGALHARQVRRSLIGVARSVRVYDALTGKDVSDHLDAGHTLEQLVPADRFSRVDLGELIKQGVPEPPFVIPGVLYEGKAHSLMGEPGDGKTLLMLGLASELVTREQTVVWFDEENGPSVIASRLAAFGVDPDNVSRYFAYFPFTEPTLDDAAELVEEVVALAPTLVVFDSGADMYVASGLNENDNMDMTRWATEFTQRLARAHGIASVVLEHVAKNSDGSYQRGAGAKKAKVDAAWRIEVRSPFDATTVGEVDLVRTKDRLAHLVERARFTIGGSDGGLVFTRVEVEDEQAKIAAAKAQKETFFRDELVRLLRDSAADSPERGISKRRLIDLLPPGIDTKVALGLIHALVHDPTTKVKQKVGARNAHLIYLDQKEVS
jgi:hypothetical protein